MGTFFKQKRRYFFECFLFKVLLNVIFYLIKAQGLGRFEFWILSYEENGERDKIGLYR